MDPANTDVMIVGAGPTGLALATALAIRGIQTTVVDAEAAGSNTSRAAVVHARTLEVLESIGVTDRLVKIGIHARRFTIRDRDRILVTVRFDDLPTQYPYVNQVMWGSRFRVHHRVVDTYRAGRILLAGDAAHVHSPAGGQGMNTGIQDAIVLAEALATALTRRSEEPLNDYGAIRRPIAREVVVFTDRLTRLATVGRGLRPLRNTSLKFLDLIPAFRRQRAWRLSGLVYR
jgi:2-polyprenyl-6-methoxyphenol hydroxylase-like FAD-dependent oxidoreductase